MEENKVVEIDEQEIKRKRLSRSRIFALLIVISVLLIGYLIYQIIAIATL